MNLMNPTIFDLARIERSILALEKKMDRMLSELKKITDECDEEEYD